MGFILNRMLDRDRVGVKEATVNDAVDDGILLKSFKVSIPLPLNSVCAYVCIGP